MNLISLLCFYDEPPESIASHLLGLQRAGVEHLVVVDGAYALYPDGRAASDPNQHAALALGCRQLGIALTLHVPATTWQGNEVEKRTFLFALGLAVSEPGDWFLVIDTDEVIVDAPADLRDRLAGTDRESGQVQMIDVPALEANNPTWPAEVDDWRLFRAQRLRAVTKHNTWVTDDGRYLRHGTDDTAPEPSLDVTDMVIHHLPQQRSQERMMAKLQYYARRDEAGIERGVCAWCGERAVRQVGVNWEFNQKMGVPVAEWREACAEHAEVADKVTRLHGVDPATLENRNGRPPVEVTA